MSPERRRTLTARAGDSGRKDATRRRSAGEVGGNESAHGQEKDYRSNNAKILLADFLYRDVAEWCRQCQKHSPIKNFRAPLVPLPVIEEPFGLIAMDVVGPLPRSGLGNKYVLVVRDYATRYPEAIPMKTVDAEHVAEELVTMFTRVGVPREILTDQGTNFTSKLLSELYRLLHVRPIRTSPYHPQTDGLVERFNETLKSMLRKTAQKGKDWDKLLPYLLFAYREVPQASTGFSPFELMYGRHVRGPLDILRESWTSSKCSGESVVSYVLTVQQKLARMTELVRTVRRRRWSRRDGTIEMQGRGSSTKEIRC